MFIKNKFLLRMIALSFFITTCSYAQDFKKNTISVEILGNSILYSLNYDRSFKISEKLNLIPRVGFMYFPLSRFKRNYDYNNVSIPLELNLTWHKNSNDKNYPELGFGFNLIGMISGYSLDELGNKQNITNTFAKISTLRLGFRHQKPEGGLMYRAGILVRLTQDDFSRSRVGDDLFYRLWPGFSVGYTF